MPTGYQQHHQNYTDNEHNDAKEETDTCLQSQSGKQTA
jgi:hypothetical protein